jgi:polysaccharide biosynthesis PFTS motif protein
MKESHVIFEAPTLADRRKVADYIRLGHSVYIIEPFWAYHHRGTIPFFPPPLPGYIEEILEQGNASLISAEQLGARDITLIAADKAVEAVEKVFPVYRQENEKLINFVIRTLNSTDAEKIFKKNLCDGLGIFFSLNTMLHRVAEILGYARFMVFPRANVERYLYLQDLVAKSKINYHRNESLSFPVQLLKHSSLENVFKGMATLFRVILQVSASMFSALRRGGGGYSSRKYQYGVTVVAPKRQLRENQRGPDFLVDNRKIRPNEIVYLPLVTLSKSQKRKLLEMDGNVYELPKLGRFFSNWPQWARLFLLCMSYRLIRSGNEIEVASSALFNYFRWDHVMRHIDFRCFITHCDFGLSHISRNILLKQRGIETWYFEDTMNYGNAFREQNKTLNRHPNWSFLHYDHFVTWNGDVADYFRSHPRSFRDAHIVGCLWSGHVSSGAGRKKYLSTVFKDTATDDKFIIAAYSSTYTVNSITSYEEGITFAEHLMKLANDCGDIVIILKEKKERSRRLIEPRLGAKLLELYEKIDAHPRMKICSNELDASVLMGVADMCISFPFTSTTFEALSARKLAIWHDPMGLYRNTPYGKLDGITTHGYEELKKRVREATNRTDASFQDVVADYLSLFDPFSDGKAIDRFRNLLKPR